MKLVHPGGLHIAFPEFSQRQKFCLLTAHYQIQLVLLVVDFIYLFLKTVYCLGENTIRIISE